MNDSCFPYTLNPNFMSPIHSWGNSSKNLNSILAQCGRLGRLNFRNFFQNWLEEKDDDKSFLIDFLGLLELEALAIKNYKKIKGDGRESFIKVIVFFFNLID